MAHKGGKIFASLRFFNYRVWFLTALVANVGTWIQRIAQDWLVLVELTDDSGLAVGITTALQFVPALLFSPIAGVTADRHDRRKLLMLTQGGQALTALGLGALVISGHATVTGVYIFAFISGVVAAFDSPARQVFVSDMVPAASLPNAVGLNSTSFNMARLVGPGLTGIMIAAWGTGPAFIVNGISFLATIGGLMLMKVDELHPATRAPRHRGQLREGVRYVKQRTDIGVIMIVIGVVSALGLNYQLTSGVMAREVFDRGPEEYGVLGSVMAIGSLVGALMAARRTHPRTRLVVGSAFAFSIASGLSAIAPSYETFALSAVAVGYTTLTMLTAANATIQVTTDASLRGRVMALYMMVLLGSTPIGAPVIGWVAEAWGARWSIGVGAIASFMVAVVAAWWVRRNWHIEVAYSLVPRPRLTITGPTERFEDKQRAEAAARATTAA